MPLRESLLTPAAAAARLGCSVEALIELAEEGRIVHYRVGSQRRFDPQRLAITAPAVDEETEGDEEEAPEGPPDVSATISELAAGLEDGVPLVYALEAGEDGPIKIGFVQRLGGLRPRLRALQAGCPYELRLLALTRGDLMTEGALHRRLEAHRIRGEWFEREPALAIFPAGDCRHSISLVSEGGAT